MENGELNRAGDYVYKFRDHNKVNRAAALVASAKTLLSQAMNDQGKGYGHAVALYTTCLEMEPGFAMHAAAENGPDLMPRDLIDNSPVMSPGQLQPGGHPLAGVIHAFNSEGRCRCGHSKE